MFSGLVQIGEVNNRTLFLQRCDEKNLNQKKWKKEYFKAIKWDENWREGGKTVECFTTESKQA